VRGLALCKALPRRRCVCLCVCERKRETLTHMHCVWARPVQGSAEKEVCMFVCVCGRAREKERDSDAHALRVGSPYTKHVSEGGVCV